MPSENRPKVGIGVIVMKDGKVPLGRRHSSHKNRITDDRQIYD